MDVEAGARARARREGRPRSAPAARRRPAGCSSSTAAPATSTAPTASSSRTTPGALAADPHADDGVRAFWEAAFPRAYAPLVDRYGPPAGNPELYLYAIMRKESGFDPHDVSYADARGLLQMIPPTSARVAEKARRAVLPRPALRPRGEHPPRRAATSARSIKKFGGEVPLAAGAYNAGPRAMARWCTQHARPPHRRVRRAGRVRADARVRQARHQPLRQVPLPLRPHALRDPAHPRHQGRRRRPRLLAAPITLGFAVVTANRKSSRGRSFEGWTAGLARV